MISSAKKLDDDEKIKIQEMLKNKKDAEIFDPLKTLAHYLRELSKNNENIFGFEQSDFKPKKKIVKIAEESSQIEIDNDYNSVL